MTDFIEPGEMAPDFTLPSDRGNSVTLSQFRGQPVVLYFYPKDNTPGCTREACAFRDAHEALQQAGAVVLGVSPDSIVSHAGFRDKFALNFLLLSDPAHKVSERYGAWREKDAAGKVGMQRSTYLIDPQGRVVQVWQKVSVDGHDAVVLKALEALKAHR